MRSKKIETGGKSIMFSKDDFELFRVEDCRLAVEAANSMSIRFKEDVAIQDDLSVVLLRDAQRPILEIIRHE